MPSTQTNNNDEFLLLQNTYHRQYNNSEKNKNLSNGYIRSENSDNKYNENGDKCRTGTVMDETTNVLLDNKKLNNQQNRNVDIDYDDDNDDGDVTSALKQKDVVVNIKTNCVNPSDSGIQSGATGQGVGSSGETLLHYHPNEANTIITSAQMNSHNVPITTTTTTTTSRNPPVSIFRQPKLKRPLIVLAIAFMVLGAAIGALTIYFFGNFTARSVDETGKRINVLNFTQIHLIYSSAPFA